MARIQPLPEGVMVHTDGSWTVGGFPVQHRPSLRYLKKHLVFAEGGAYLEDGARRLPIEVEGPVFEVLRLVLDPIKGTARVVLDDGSEESIDDSSLLMSPTNGRFECMTREGRARAVFSREAHQTLLDHVEDEVAGFFLVVGERRFPVRT